MNKKIWLCSVILLLLVVVSCTSKETPAPEPLPVETVEPTPPILQETSVDEEASPARYTIEITATGFNPKTLNIKAGDIVTFTNQDTTEHWPVSALHPTHMTYPGSDIRKCGTAEQSTIFDACAGLQQEEEFTFTFTNKGRWPYHDHLRPSVSGTVVVE